MVSRLAEARGQCLATAANAFDHAVERRILLVDRIIRIHQVFLRRHLISARLAVADGRLRYRLLVRAHQRSWGRIWRTTRFRPGRRGADPGHERHSYNQLSPAVPPHY